MTFENFYFQFPYPWLLSPFVIYYLFISCRQSNSPQLSSWTFLLNKKPALNRKGSNSKLDLLQFICFLLSTCLLFTILAIPKLQYPLLIYLDQAHILDHMSEKEFNQWKMDIADLKAKCKTKQTLYLHSSPFLSNKKVQQLKASFQPSKNQFVPEQYKNYKGPKLIMGLNSDHYRNENFVLYSNTIKNDTGGITKIIPLPNKNFYLKLSYPPQNIPFSLKTSTRTIPLKNKPNWVLFKPQNNEVLVEFLPKDSYPLNNIFYCQSLKYHKLKWNSDQNLPDNLAYYLDQSFLPVDKEPSLLITNSLTKWNSHLQPSWLIPKATMLEKNIFIDLPSDHSYSLSTSTKLPFTTKHSMFFWALAEPPDYYLAHDPKDTIFYLDSYPIIARSSLNPSKTVFSMTAQQIASIKKTKEFLILLLSKTFNVQFEQKVVDQSTSTRFLKELSLIPKTYTDKYHMFILLVLSLVFILLPNLVKRFH